MINNNQVDGEWMSGFFVNPVPTHTWCTRMIVVQGVLVLKFDDCCCCLLTQNSAC